VVVGHRGARAVGRAETRTFHRDPADRIIVATARVHDATLLTRDERIIEARLVPTIG